MNVSDKSILSQPEVEKYLYLAQQDIKKVVIAVSGQAFAELFDKGWIPQYLDYIRIFSRMTPLDKVTCVRAFMAENITAMCGDGGNDAGALKAAHVGLALSPSAGSSVISHFTSSNCSISSCVYLLKVARCSLDVSLSSYK
jgi:magnesium-transporting ATPase (P-type)